MFLSSARNRPNNAMIAKIYCFKLQRSKFNGELTTFIGDEKEFQTPTE